MFDKFIPYMYYKNIFAINYEKLKKDNIKILIFDLDNTIMPSKEENLSDDTIELINRLKKDFIIYIASNNYKKRVSKVADVLDIRYISFSMKPFTKALKIIKKKEICQKNEMIIIGDQLLTDICCGNRFKIKNILVDRLNKDLKITGFNRKIEDYIIKRFTRKNIFKRGRYYG